MFGILKRLLKNATPEEQEEVGRALLTEDRALFAKLMADAAGDEASIAVNDWPMVAPVEVEAEGKPRLTKAERRALQSQAPAGYQLCWKCCDFKPEADFSADARLPQRNFHRHYCKDCDKSYNKTF